MSDDMSTQRFDAPLTSSKPPSGGPTPDDGKKKVHALMVALIATSAVLLVVLIVVLVFLFRGNGTPSSAVTPTNSARPSATPSVTPSATPGPTPSASARVPTAATTTAPNDGNVHITGFSVTPTKVDCSPGSAELQVNWSSTNGSIAYFGVDTADAETGGMGWMLHPSGTQRDFPGGYDPFLANCGSASTNYTITIVGNGSKQSRTVTVTKK